MLHHDDPAIVAIASDEPLAAARVPVVDLDDIDGIADTLIRYAAPLDAIPAHAGPG
jgi:molybdopterin-guanine dinucleotide biosynthesis protein B